MSGKRIQGDSSTIPHNPAGVEKKTPQVDVKESTAISVGHKQDISFREHDTSDTAAAAESREKKKYHAGNKSDEYKDAGTKFDDPETHVPHSGAPYTTGNRLSENEAADTKYPDTGTHARHLGHTHTLFQTGNISHENKDAGRKFQDTGAYAGSSIASHTTGNRSDEFKDNGIIVHGPETHVSHSGAPYTTGNRSSEYEADETKYSYTETHARHSGATHTTGNISHENKDAGRKFQDTGAYAGSSIASHTTGNRSDENKDAGSKFHDPETHVPHSGASYTTGNISHEYKDTSTKFQDTGAYADISSASHTIGNISLEYKDDGRKVHDTVAYAGNSSASHTTGNRSDEYKDTDTKFHEPETHVRHSGAPYTTGNRSREYEAEEIRYSYTETHARHSGATHTTGNISHEYKDDGRKVHDTGAYAGISSASNTTGNRSDEYKDADTKFHDPETHVHHSGAPYTSGSRTAECEAADIVYHGPQTHSRKLGAPYTGRRKAELRKTADGIPCIIWPDIYKRQKVPYVFKEFVLYVPDKDTRITARIKLFDLDIKMVRAKSDCMFKRKVHFQGDYPSSHQYCYETELPGLMFGTRTAKCKITFELDRGETLRDCFEGKSADGILAHMNDIERCKLDLRETYTQMEGLNSAKLVEKDQKQLFSKMSSEVQCCFREKRRIRTVVVFFIINNAAKIDLDLSNEAARQFLHIFEDARLLQLKSSFSTLVVTLISKLCRQSFDNDTIGIVELCYSYSWLDEHPFDSKCDIRNVPVKYKNYVVSLFMKIYQSGSFESETSKKITKTIINDLPFAILISTYADLIKREIFEESYNTFKSIIQQETLKRTEKKLCVLGDDKMANFLTIWEDVRDIGDGHVPFQKIFEKCFVELMALSSLRHTEKIVQIAQEQILFATPKSKSELLKAIASSPNYVTSELFVKLACVPGFVEVYIGLDTAIYEQWYYNSRDTRKSNKLRSMKLIAERLLFIVTLANAPDNKEIVTIIKSILFDELKRQSFDKVLTGAVDFAKISKENSVLISCFIDYISGVLQTVTTDVEKLFGPFLSGGELQLKTR